MQSKISVILPTFNGASRGYLKEAIESVLLQTYPDFELIIINDGSTDNTDGLCRKYADKPCVRYISQENKGLAAARNAGIKHSKGEYICLLDDDDLWLKDKLQQQIGFFMDSNDASLGMVYCAAELIDDNGNIFNVRYKDIGDDAYRKLLLEGNIISCPSSVMIKRDVLDRVGVFDEEMKSAEDLELWLRISRQYRIRSIPQYLVKYRVHANSITVNSCKREEFFEYSLYFRLIQEGLNINLNEDRIFGNLYQRTAIRHFSMGDYRQVRKFYRIAAAYTGTSLAAKAAFLLAHFPFIAETGKAIRRRIRLGLFKSNRQPDKN